MIVWASEFPLQAGRNVGDVLDAARKWLVGSPHWSWTVADLEGAVEGELHSIDKWGQEVRQASIESEGAAWAGLRHSWVEDKERRWTTEIVGHESGEGLTASVRVDCQLLVAGKSLPPARKPYVVQVLLRELGGGLDGGLRVDDEPIRVLEAEVDKVARVVRGELDNRLPVVYVSVDWASQAFINPDELARWLSGMAHVLVEPSRMFSFQLARNADRANAYGGAVSIYWPEGVARQTRYLPRRYSAGKQMQVDVAARIQSALAQIQPTSECTWSFLREVVSKARIAQLDKEGSTELEQWIEAFSEEGAAKDQQIEDLRRELGRLRADLWRYEQGSTGDGEGLLAAGEEQEFYAGEAMDALLHTLRIGRNSLLDDGRRRHIVDSVLSANEPSGMEDDFEEALKNSLTTMKSFGAAERAALQDLGFVLEEGGKHIRAEYRGDGRYAFTIQKTGSDHRAGRNLIGEIRRKLFG